MIQALGIDSIEINRFLHWNYYKKETLLKVFLPHEIDYCLAIPTKTAERFALRFAAKEAFFKAFSTLYSSKNTISLLTICKNVGIAHNAQKIPYLDIAWDTLEAQLGVLKSASIRSHISLTHTKTTATAIVILEKYKNA
jgi:holo-[acyl-carrier protein] synthase